MEGNNIDEDSSWVDSSNSYGDLALGGTGNRKVDQAQLYSRLYLFNEVAQKGEGGVYNDSERMTRVYR